MACDTKERIIEEALRLFSEKGYAGTSMSDIAERLKITKAALYKHYSGKREIFQKILDRMSALDAERAAEYDMPGRPGALPAMRPLGRLPIWMWCCPTEERETW